jgi:hypothetical protein
LGIVLTLPPGSRRPSSLVVERTATLSLPIKTAVMQYLLVLEALFLAPMRLERRTGLTFDVVLEAEEEIFVVDLFFIFVLDEDVVRAVVEVVVENRSWLLELKGLVRWSVIYGLDDAFPTGLDVSVDELFLVNIEDVLLV